MQVLYQWEQQGLFERKTKTVPIFIDTIELTGLLGHFLHNFYQKDLLSIDMPFITDLVQGTVRSLPKVDALIDETSTKWKLSRMDAIDRAILRLACYELVVKGELSAQVVINEAVELAKKYGSEQSPSFINGILDAIYTSQS